MSVYCERQENCPLVLAACERKVKAETNQRLAEVKLSDFEADYSRRRKVMNELFAAGVSMRKAQREYFQVRSEERLYDAKQTEARFDKALESCRNLGKPQQATLKGVA